MVDDASPGGLKFAPLIIEVRMKTPARPRAQPDGSSEPLNKVEKPRSDETSAKIPSDAEDDHIGATEDQVSDTSPPAGEAYKDEPRQG
jgi:hypothetical protein